MIKHAMIFGTPFIPLRKGSALALNLDKDKTYQTVEGGSITLYADKIQILVTVSQIKNGLCSLRTQKDWPHKLNGTFSDASDSLVLSLKEVFERLGGVASCYFTILSTLKRGVHFV